MRNRVPVLGLVLLSVDSAAQTDEPWQPFVLSRVAPTLQSGQVAVETGAGYNGLPQTKTGRLDDSYQGSSWISGSVGLIKGTELSASVGISQVPSRGWGLADARAELRFKLLDRPFGLPVRESAAAPGELSDPPRKRAQSGESNRLPRRVWEMNGSRKLLFWWTAWLALTLCVAVSQADELDARDTLLVDAATAGPPISKEFGSDQEVSYHSDKTISAYVLHPVASFLALGVGSTFDDRHSLDPSPSVRLQLLSQQHSGINLTAVFRFKSSGFFPGTQEVKAGLSAGRDFGRMDVLANVAVGTTAIGAIGMGVASLDF